MYGLKLMLSVTTRTTSYIDKIELIKFYRVCLIESI